MPKCKWHLEGNDLLNPHDKIVAILPANLTFAERQELIERIIHAPYRAYQEGSVDASDGEELLPVPERFW
jgi:hypothetical protein